MGYNPLNKLRTREAPGGSFTLSTHYSCRHMVSSQPSYYFIQKQHSTRLIPPSSSKHLKHFLTSRTQHSPGFPSTSLLPPSQAPLCFLPLLPQTLNIGVPQDSTLVLFSTCCTCSPLVISGRCLTLSTMYMLITPVVCLSPWPHSHSWTTECTSNIFIWMPSRPLQIQYVRN